MLSTLFKNNLFYKMPTLWLKVKKILTEKLCNTHFNNRFSASNRLHSCCKKKTSTIIYIEMDLKLRPLNIEFQKLSYTVSRVRDGKSAHQLPQLVIFVYWSHLWILYSPLIFWTCFSYKNSILNYILFLMSVLLCSILLQC